MANFAKKTEETEDQGQTEEPKRAINILPSNRKEASYVTNHHTIVADTAHEPDDYLNPNAYASIANKFQPNDEITILPEDNRYYMKLFVVSIGRNWVEVRELYRVNLEKAKGIPIDSGEKNDSYEVMWKGPMLKFCVIRKEDKSVVEDRFASKPEAVVAMGKHMQSMGR